MTTAPQATKGTDSITGRDTLVWDFGTGANCWEDARDFVLREFPAAQWTGIGYWKIPRTAEIVYGVGKVTYIPMKGKALPQ